jgi:mannose-6-phosphate isomerase-like protein (cupin superfamily)
MLSEHTNMKGGARMRRMWSAALFLSVLLVAGVPAAAQTHATSGGHVMLAPGDVQWIDGPASLPPGARFAVIKGDLSKAEPFIFRVRVPAGYRIPPHYHPVDEHVTVVEGTFGVGMGTAFDKAQGRKLEAGSIMVMPAGERHFAWAETDLVLQLHGTGPWNIVYVNPADDPRGQQTRR